MTMLDGRPAEPAKKRKRVSRVERSRRIWEEVEQAVAAVAARRGWPHENFEDLDQAVRHLDEENPNPYRSFWTGFHASLLFRDNAQYDFMEMSEVKATQPRAEKFVKRLESL